MKKVQLACLMLLLIISMNGCTQKYGIYQANAYYRQSSRGTQQVNDAGQPVGSPIIKEDLIYVETATGKIAPAFTTAWIEGKSYNVQAVAAEKASLGTMKEGGQPVSLAPAEGHQLWQLQLTESPGTKVDAAITEAMQSNAIVLTGTWKGKPFTYTIKMREQLEGVMYQ
ncbi:MAG: hypothetical protein JWP88_1332 [Flaviaesturariibacter sp.]|nr:hypothetical protein [Flaviaesturariibacter sp.]